MKYQLAIAHRVCPALAKTAAFYTDKFEMVKATANSLAKALTGIRTKLVVILDGCPREYEQLFDEIFMGIDGVCYERIATPSIGNHVTYSKQMEILWGLKDCSEFLYFSEDDYLYKDSAFNEMMDFLRQPDVDFVSPLDHPDAYLPFGEAAFGSCIRYGASCHWREAGTTCCTFMLRSERYDCAMKGLSYYSNGGTDFIMWLGLTKFHLYSISVVLGGALRYLIARLSKHEMNDKDWILAVPMVAWLKIGWRLLFGKKFRLWTPIPSLGLHLCEPSLPPCCDMKMWRDKLGGNIAVDAS